MITHAKQIQKVSTDVHVSDICIFDTTCSTGDRDTKIGTTNVLMAFFQFGEKRLTMMLTQIVLLLVLVITTATAFYWPRFNLVRSFGRGIRGGQYNRLNPWLFRAMDDASEIGPDF